MKKNKKTSDAAQILFKLFVEGNPEMEAQLEEERTNIDVAEQISLLRAEAGLTQAELAEKIGTTASAISRLENADYEGHSITMLRRIATALNKQLKISFVPLKGHKAA